MHFRRLLLASDDHTFAFVKHKIRSHRCENFFAIRQRRINRTILDFANFLFQLYGEAFDVRTANGDAVICRGTGCRKLAFDNIQTAHLFAVDIATFGEFDAVNDPRSSNRQYVRVERDNDLGFVQFVMGTKRSAKCSSASFSRVVVGDWRISEPLSTLGGELILQSHHAGR